MEDLFEYLNTVEDKRQQRKVRHKMGDIIALVFFAFIANADDFVGIELFGKEHKVFLRKYLELPNGILLFEVGNKPLSMRKKRFVVGINPQKHLERLLDL